MSDNAEVVFRVEPLQITLFARAIGDEHPAYVNAPQLAPPTFTESLQHVLPDYRFRPRANRPWIGTGGVAGEAETPATTPASETTLHAEQRFEYHQRIEAGAELFATTREGSTWQKEGRAGTMRFFERITEFRDARGQLVLTSTLVGVTVPTAAEAS
ncbi:MAG: hypothetical protein JWQ19_1726 [Subtercola sp.]|nr:hypothetical protein [Subtercola sp.]